jgi:hypothetical protein
MLVGDSLATLAGILEQNDQNLHVETIEEAYQIIQESQLHAHSNQSRRAAFGTLRQETTNGFVPRQQPNLDTGFTTGFTTSEKPKINDWINMGYFVFQPQIFDLLGTNSVLEEAPLTSLASRSELGAYKHSGFWQPMDTHREYLSLNSLWSSGSAPWKSW